MMCSPSNETGPHSYEVIACSENPPQQHLPPYNTDPTGNVQYIPNVPNVHFTSPMMNPSTSVPQWSAAITMPQKTPTSVMHKTKGLVILMIVACVVQFILGIGMLFTLMHYTLYSGVPFWGLVSYLVAACLTSSAQNTTSSCVVKGSLALNIVSAITSGLGIIMACLDIVVVSIGCPLYANANYFCQGRSIGAIVVYTLLIVTYLILFCVSISLAVYGCRSLDTTPSAPQVYLVPNIVTPASTALIPAPPMACTQTSPSCDNPVEDRS